MGKIIQNGIEYSGTYSNATSINYDNTESGLNAKTVQEAVDELAAGGVGNDNLGEDENGMTVHEKLDYLIKRGIGGAFSLKNFEQVYSLSGTYTATEDCTAFVVYSGADWSSRNQSFSVTTDGEIIGHERLAAGGSDFGYFGSDLYAIELKQNGTITYEGHNSLSAATFMLFTMRATL